MSQIEKLEQRLLSKPKDFTFQEAERLLKAYGFRRLEGGKTSGSRVKFICQNKGVNCYLHKPHPGNVLKTYQLDDLINVLKEGGLLR